MLPSRGALDPMDQSGVYEMSTLAQKKASGGIYQMAIKSAAATVGANVPRADPNSLQMTVNQEEAMMMMHHTGDMLVKQNVSVMGGGAAVN